MAWTDEKAELLRKLRDEGRTRRQIAVAIGDSTINSIASKIKQLSIARECKSAWTDGKVELLRQLWLSGSSASECAAKLGQGLTRNAVISKVHRIGLAAFARAVVPKSRKTRALVRSRPRRQFNGLPPTRAVFAGPAVVAVPIECVGVSLLDLNQGMCKWSLGDERYCGNPAPWREPYCAGHARIAYVPASYRKRLDRQFEALAA